MSQLQTTKLTVSQQHESPLRDSPFVGKPSSFDECDSEVMNISRAEFDTLRCYDSDEIYGKGVDVSPFDDHPAGDDMLFFFKYKGKLYLINTEGFSYFRYVVRVDFLLV